MSFNYNHNKQVCYHSSLVAPQNLSPPTSTNSTSTTLTVTWFPPSLPNGDIETYLLYGESNGILTNPVIITSTSNLVGTLSSLRPNTAYNVFVTAANQYGDVTSDAVMLTTLESGMYLYIYTAIKVCVTPL